jgi:hypothetical protein
VVFQDLLKSPIDKFVLYARNPRKNDAAVDHPFHDRTVVITSCGRLCLYRENQSEPVSRGLWASRKSIMASGWSASRITISVITIWRKEPCSPRKSLRAKSVTYVSGPHGNGCEQCRGSGYWSAHRHTDYALGSGASIPLYHQGEVPFRQQSG